MQVKFDDLEGGTEFKYNGRKFKKGGSSWSTKMVDSYMGEQAPKEEHESVYECHPFLGGRYQSKIRMWIRIDTMVEVD